MTAKIKSTVPVKVALSHFHNGQAVYPVVTAIQEWNGHVWGVCTVELSWAGPENKKPRGTFSGTRQECEAWLMDRGVHLDAQGIY